MGKHFTFEKIPDMTGKVCIVTGGNTGVSLTLCQKNHTQIRLICLLQPKIGKICGLELAKKNAHVIITSRTPSKGLAAVEESKQKPENDNVEFLQLDLLSLASVTNFLSEFKAKNLPLHLLLNNAGIPGDSFSLSEDGIESHFATNHVRGGSDHSYVEY